MTDESNFPELRLRCPATLDRPKPMRHALSAFLTAIDVTDDTRDDILTAVGEALANAVEHAHAPGSVGIVELTAHLGSPKSMVIEVRDDGRFIERDGPREARGFGLRIIGAIAKDVSVSSERGTRIRMSFALEES